ncbi:hypothetical protein HYH03_010395 [Edaphochlamys debaryana]|uniref:Uncharacterized protein n=1 Tax=Edaphochlamys debaryana TaxID=47281 RepID=A0A836BW80_9CHLO|nr:hypothetical protein HYH03_010395 [Edaphochlamys debaryana]|eukprot:KAG2491185.1 hypothetical protein HYH03_010395 [Edaphochlamys debaryana]
MPSSISCPRAPQYADLSLCDIAASTLATNTTNEPPPGSPPLKPWLGFLLARWHEPSSASPSADATAAHATSTAARALAWRRTHSAPSGAARHRPALQLSWSNEPPTLQDLQDHTPARTAVQASSSSKPSAAAASATASTAASAVASTAADAAPEAGTERCAPLGLQPGRWVWSRGWDGAAQAEAASLARTCVWPAKLPSGITPPTCLNNPLQFNRSASALTWQASGCTEPKLADFDTKACLARQRVGPSHGGRKICVLGDSHSRYLSYALDAWATEFAQSEQHDCRKWDKSPPVSDYVALLGDPWAERDTAQHAENCSHIIVNNGHWPASFQAAGRTRVVYALSLGQPVQWRKLLGQDWRTEPIMEQYNYAAMQIAAELGFPVLDLWGPSVGLTEGTWDGSHFFYKGAVGHVLLTRAVASLCS